MNTKSIAILLIGSFLLLGCAGADHYPITGNAVGINDQVQFMSAPEITRY